jgi:hypothetical protein
MITSIDYVLVKLLSKMRTWVILQLQAILATHCYYILVLAIHFLTFIKMM